MELINMEALGVLSNRLEDYLSQACRLCNEVYGFGGDLEADREDLALIKKDFHRTLLNYESKRNELSHYLDKTKFPSEAGMRQIMDRYKLPKHSKVEAILS